MPLAATVSLLTVAVILAVGIAGYLIDKSVE
jgi:preprotein translocase subunit Sss1